MFYYVYLLCDIYRMFQKISGQVGPAKQKH
jgi:hypothetical protein